MHRRNTGSSPIRRPICKTGMTLWLEEFKEELLGDAWARFYLRYAELKNSVD